MSARMSIRQMAVQSLRAMAYLTPNDDETHVEPHTLDIVAQWLDMNVAQLCGTTRIMWLIGETIPIPLIANQPTYQLTPTNLSSPGAAALTTNEDMPIRTNSVGIDGISFPVQAWATNRRDNAPRSRDIELIRRWEWDNIEHKNQSGQPQVFYINRMLEPIGRPWPIPSDDDWTIHLRYQAFAPDASSIGAERAYIVEQSWNRWIIMKTAADIGRGPIRRIKQADIDDLEVQAKNAKDALLSFMNDDHYKPRFNQPFEF